MAFLQKYSLYMQTIGSACRGVHENSPILIFNILIKNIVSLITVIVRWHSI